MKEDLLKIVDEFGINNQLKKLNEECFELIEAVRDYEEELNLNDFETPDKEHIIEEMADLQVVANQIIGYYDIDHKEIFDIATKKINRTLERIETGYYKKGE